MNAPHHLRCEYLENPLGLDETAPRFSWWLDDPRRGAAQTAYELSVATSEAALDSEDASAWRTGQVMSGETAQTVYQGEALRPRTRYSWRVRVWDHEGVASPWSAAAWFETGHLDSNPWQASWIALESGLEADRPATYLRRSFEVNGDVVRARLYATARGIYLPRMNGGAATQDLFRPGWTDYNLHLQYQTYDVADLIRPGENVLAAVLGDGWYCSYMSIFGPNTYGKLPQFLGQLHIEYADGREEIIATDAAWRVSRGPITRNDHLNGEDYDARLEMPGWDAPGFDASGWSEPCVLPRDATPLKAQCAASVRRLRECSTQGIAEPKTGVYVVDLGQNMVGWVRLRVRGEAGTVVTLRHAEMCNPDGTIYTENLRAAQCTDRYTLKGDGEEVYEPSLTFHGFRYLELTGLPAPPDENTVTGVVLNSDCPEVGTFSCSNALVNQLQSNIVWSQRGNFFEVPTDCPQRDERLGWTGDAQVYVRTACFNMDVAAFFKKWLVDLNDAQTDDGAYPCVAPRVPLGEGQSAWGDAGVICPWIIYQVYGDRRVLEQHYDKMAAWIDYLEANSDGLIRPEAACFFADWLSINTVTPKDLTGTAYFARSTRIMADVARVLGKTDDAERFEALFSRIRDAFVARFIDAEGRVPNDSQSGYLFALNFGLMPEELREKAVVHLVRDIQNRETHLSTGFLGVGQLLPCLTEHGHTDLAYALLLQTTFPSWGYEIAHGATTIWEHWNGWTEADGFQNPEMNSFNHYSFGAVGEWMYANIGGIELDAPGFTRLRMSPRPGGGLTHARATYDSIQGRIESAWRIDGGVFSWEVTIPANTTAILRIPDAASEPVTENGNPLERTDGITQIEHHPGATHCHAAAGTYTFRSILPSRWGRVLPRP